MPEFKIPTTPEQWAAVETNETDAALLNSAELHLAYTPKSEFDKHLALAAASRLLERERCVKALAELRCRGNRERCRPGSKHHTADGFACDRCIRTCRRDLEDAK